MHELLAVIGLTLFAAALLAAVPVTAGWLVWRRLRCNRLIAAVRAMTGHGVLPMLREAPSLVPSRTGARHAIRIVRAHRQLRARVIAAGRAGADLGDVPALLPGLEAEGRRIRAGLSQPTPQLLAQADQHLTTLAELSGAVADALGNAGDPHLTERAREAATGLRLRSDAYRELAATGPLSAP